MGVIRFYEGAAATQHYIGKLSSNVSQVYDLSLISAPVPNEQALSCTLLAVESGTKIKLYSSPVPTADEGCTEITVLTFVEDKCVPYFNVDGSDDDIQVKVHQGDSEPGKVCRIEVLSS